MLDKLIGDLPTLGTFILALTLALVGFGRWMAGRFDGLDHKLDGIGGRVSDVEGVVIDHGFAQVVERVDGGRRLTAAHAAPVNGGRNP